MCKPRAVEAAAAAVAATAPGPEMVEQRGPGRPRSDGVSRLLSRTEQRASRAGASRTWAQQGPPSPPSVLASGTGLGQLPFFYFFVFWGFFAAWRSCSTVTLPGSV